MSRFHSYVSSAIKIIDTYSAGKPLTFHTKAFFAADKKYGSRDRRMITSICYYYFRTGHAFNSLPKEEKIILSVFLCENNSNELLKFFRPDLEEKISLPLKDKVGLLGVCGRDIFPFDNELSEKIDADNFGLSFLLQPKLYLRARPRKGSVVADKLTKANLTYKIVEDDCFMLDQGSSIDSIIKLNKEAVVQDLNSQKVLDQLDNLPELLSTESKLSAWDCCAASGGKSILLFDKLKGNVKLTVSDVRQQILVNLQQRLLDAGINLDKYFVADLTTSAAVTIDQFDIIICDAPCTGSGTWSRTPEQLFRFDKTMIEEYTSRQQKIALNSIRQLKKGGLFFYITCSVFKKENEELVNFIQQNKPVANDGSRSRLQEMQYLTGYESAADTLFVAVFQSN